MEWRGIVRGVWEDGGRGCEVGHGAFVCGEEVGNYGDALDVRMILLE